MGVIDQIIENKDVLPKADFHIPIMSLPYVLGEGYKFSYPRTQGLKADPSRVAFWQQQLPSHTQYKIGICWQGRTTFGSDEIRSFKLMEFLPLAAHKVVSLISLQKEPAGKQQIREFRLFADLLDVDEIIATERDFMETAAIMKTLDLVITSDTSVAHLAGALGIQVWLVLGKYADWRWFTDQQQSYWYPSMRLFRSQVDGHWEQVFMQMDTALLTQLSTRNCAS